MGGDKIMGFFDPLDFEGRGSKRSADAAKDAAATAAASQQEALDYLKEIEALPQALRQAALSKLGGVYGLSGIETGGGTGGGDLQALQAQKDKLTQSLKGTPTTTTTYAPYGGQAETNAQYDARIADPILWQGIHGPTGSRTSEPIYTTTYTPPANAADIQRQIGLIDQQIAAWSSAPQQTSEAGDTSGQQDLINQAMSSPLYGALMGGQELGEEAIMRNAGATGGLRSGNVQGAMYDYNTQLQNQALLSSYNEQLQGLQGLAGLPSNANNIAQGTANVGSTFAQGIAGKAAAENMGQQNQTNNLMGIAAMVASMFSDRRLKKNIKLVSKVKGFNFYSFDWNKIANMLGLDGSTYGCMAEEVYSKVPEAVTLKDGFLFVNYRMIGVL
jgi:hypothetical protein